MREKISFLCLLCIFLGIPLFAVKVKNNGQAIASSQNRFCWKLYSELAKEEGNLFISPYSIYQALMMAYIGSDGQTKSEMYHTLSLPKFSKYQISKANKTLLGGLPTGFTNAQAIAISNSYIVADTYLKQLQKKFNASLFAIDLLSPQASLQAINDWVTKKTDNRITSVLSENDLNEKLRILLLNAVSFKRAWATPFAKERTKRQFFITQNGDKIACELMDDTRSLPYTENDLAQITELDYVKENKEASQYSCVIILPKDGKFKEVEEKLSQKTIHRWLNHCNSTKVSLQLPKFQLKTKYELNKQLIQLGMKLAFDKQLAEFPAISVHFRPDLYIQKVIHQATLDMDEEKTEAAAVTTIHGYGITSIEPIVSMRCNRPFIFVIHDKQTGLILFAGRIVLQGPF